MTFRSIRADDEPFLFRVYASTRAEELAPVPWTEAEKEAFLRMQFSAQHRYYQEQFAGAAFQIILLEERPIGRLYVNRGAQEILVVDITLLPEFRNRGIGGAIMSDLLAEAAHAAKPVRIHVEYFNPAIRFYERLGFSKIRVDGAYFLLECLPVAQ